MMKFKAFLFVFISAVVSGTDSDALVPSAIMWCAQSGGSYIRAINDDVSNWFSADRTLVISQKTTDFSYAHIDVGYMKKTIVWIQGTSTIASQSVNGLFIDHNSTGRGTFYLDSTSAIVDIASDVYTGSVYFIDSKNKFIGITASSSDSSAISSYFKVIVRQNIYQPISLVLDPDEGVMFWLDLGLNGNQPLILKATLAGTQQHIVSKSLSFLTQPTELAIDSSDQRLYWLATVNSKQVVAHCDFSGQGESKVVLNSPYGSSGFSSLALYDDYIISAINDQSQIIVLHKNTTIVGAIVTDAVVNDIKTIGAAPNDTHACATLDCSEFCLNLGQLKGVCSCIEGHLLMPDGKTCWEFKAVSVIGSSGSSIFKSDLTIFPKNNSLDIVTKLLNIDVPSASALAFDFARNQLYSAGGLDRNIVATSMVDNGVNELTVNTANVDGMSVDWSTGNLYYTEGDRKRIMVVTDDGRYPYILAQPTSPKRVTVDASGPLFYTDGNAVYKSTLSGDAPTTIVSGEKGIEGIVSDPGPQRLVWAVNDPWLETTTYNGGDTQRYATATMHDLRAVTIFGDIMMWGQADSGKLQFIRMQDNTTIQQVNDHSPSNASISSILDIVLYSSYLQPNASGPCTTDNGGCAHLCLTTSLLSRVCACGLGFTLSTNGVSCQSELVNNSFLIMVDPYRKQIYQKSINDSSVLKGVPMSRTTQPISVDYDLKEQRMYWIEAGQAQGNAIHSATITGINETVVFDGSHTGSSPWRLAVDGDSDLVFYVDAAQGTVVSISTNDSNMKTLVSHVTNPHAIALDTRNKTIYFTADNSLYSCSYTGLNLRQLISTFVEPVALAVGADGLVYVGDKAKKVLVSVNVTSLDMVAMVTPGVWQVAALTVDSQYIYFTAWDKRAVYRVPLVNAIATQPQVFGGEDFARITDLRYVDRLLVPPVLPGPTVNLALILGILLPVIFLILLCFLILFFCYRRRHRCQACRQYHKNGHHCELTEGGISPDYMPPNEGKVNPVYRSGVPDNFANLKFEYEDKEGLHEHGGNNEHTSSSPAPQHSQEDAVDEGIVDDEEISVSAVNDDAADIHRVPPQLPVRPNRGSHGRQDNNLGATSGAEEGGVAMRQPPPVPPKKNKKINQPNFVRQQADLMTGGKPLYPPSLPSGPKHTNHISAKPANHHTPIGVRDTLGRNKNKLKRFGSHEDLTTIHTTSMPTIAFDAVVVDNSGGHQPRLSRRMSFEQLDTLTPEDVDMLTVSQLTVENQAAGDSEEF